MFVEERGAAVSEPLWRKGSAVSPLNDCKRISRSTEGCCGCFSCFDLTWGHCGIVGDVVTSRNQLFVPGPGHSTVRTCLSSGCLRRCDLCCLSFRTHRGLLRHNAGVHKLLPQDPNGRPFIQNNPSIPTGFNDLAFIDFSCKKFPHIAQVLLPSPSPRRRPSQAPPPHTRCSSAGLV